MRHPRTRALLAKIVAASLVFACRADAPTQPPLTEPSIVASNARTRDVSSTEVVSPHLSITLAARLEGRPALTVEIQARGVESTSWSIAALASATIDGVEARDDDGVLEHALAVDGARVRIQLARRARGALVLRYVLFPEQGTVPAEIPAGLALRVDHTRVLAAAEELLALPDDPAIDRVALDLTWVPHPPHLRGLATTLGALGPGAAVDLDALRHAALLAGPLGTATFRGPAGDDDFAWTGDTSFDLRWSAAEIAGARTAVDLYFGAGETRRFATLLAVDIDFPGDDGALVYPREGGLYVALSPGARWDAEARLAVASGLVHRWIGGRLRLDPGGAGPAERGAWFDLGVARAIARDVLVELGILGADDLHAELHRLIGEQRTSPLRDQGNDAAAAAAAAGDDDARALLVARGALYATRLDARLRGRGGSLRGLMRALVADAQARRSGALPLAALVDRIAADVDAAERDALRRGVLDGGPLPIPGDALGPCFVAAPRTYTRFDLGFDAARSQGEVPAVIRGLRAGGPAAKAGLREGEPLHSVIADRHDPEVPAEVVVERGGQAVTITYRPRGTSARGDGWRRKPGADPRLCPS